MVFRRRNNDRTGALVRYGVFVLAAGLWLVAGLSRVDTMSDEGRIADGICRQLLAGTTEGRQALISSVWWPPLLFLLRLPFVSAFASVEDPVGSLLVSALGAAGVLLIMERMLRRWGVGWPRWLLVCATAFHPWMIASGMDGSTTTTAICVMLVGIYGLVQWTAERQVGGMVYFALSAAVGLGLNTQLGLWAFVMLAFLMMDMAVQPFVRGRAGAAAMLVWLPFLYSAGLWFLMNWLIMGDGLYFVRGVAHWGGLRDGMDSSVQSFRYLHVATAGLLLLAAGIGILWRRRAAAFLGLAGLTALTVAVLLSAYGWLWHPSVILTAVIPLVCVVAGYLAGTAGISRALALALSVVPVGMTAGALISGWLTQAPDAPGQGRIEDPPGLLRSIEQHVMRQTRHGKVFVCGHDAFRLIGAQSSKLFVPSLDFNIDQIRHDYRGHQISVLIRRPAGLSSMDSVHWKYDRIYYFGAGPMLYDSDWGDWRLFEVIEPEGSSRGRNDAADTE